MTFHWWYAGLWLAIGMVHGYVNRNVGDWLIMITDDRNTRQTWAAIPSLLLCWIFWPIAGWLARMLFLSCRWLDSRRR